MKFLSLAVLATTILASTVNANTMSTKKVGQGIGGAAGVAVGVTASPTLFVMMVYQCLTASGPEAEGITCGLASTTAPVSSTVLALLLKEDIAQVEADAYNTLAGEEISLALEEQINKMRETFPTLAEESDEFIIAAMLELNARL